jgi:hypothetical protein
MHSQRVCRIFLVSLGLLAGCGHHTQSESIPTYPALNAPTALDILQRRAAAIHTLTARCALTLTRGDRQTVQLDGLMVMAPPDRLRLRVWKLDQAVFDLTVLPDGLWIETPSDAPQRGRVVPAALSAGQLAHFLAWFEGGFFTAPGLSAQPPQANVLVYRRDVGDGTSIVCDVDRASAVPLHFTLLDAARKTRFSLDMSDYQSISGIIWPARMSALDVDAANGDSRIAIVFSDIEFNGELTPGAFVPPKGAEKRP